MMQDKRRKSFEDRVIRDLERAFPSPDPDKHRYLVEKDKYSFYLYDSRPDEGRPGEWTRTPVAKFSFHDGEQVWQLSWMPPEGRWKKYGRYFDIDTATVIIKGDPAGCFMGQVSPLSYLKYEKKEDVK
jgi:hypothetical protein